MLERIRCQPLFLLFVCFLYCGNGYANESEDWAFGLNENAKKIYAERKIQTPCSEIGKMLKSENYDMAYFAIRDAGIFNCKECKMHIRENLTIINKKEFLKAAVAFYRYSMGDKSQLSNLMRLYEKQLLKGEEYAYFDLFGFMQEWEITISPLVKYSELADGHGTEALCSALLWKRYLYNEDKFKDAWYRIGKEEEISLKILDKYYKTCKYW